MKTNNGWFKSNLGSKLTCIYVIVFLMFGRSSFLSSELKCAHFLKVVVEAKNLGTATCFKAVVGVRKACFIYNICLQNTIAALMLPLSTPLALDNCRQILL